MCLMCLDYVMLLLTCQKGEILLCVARCLLLLLSFMLSFGWLHILQGENFEEGGSSRGGRTGKGKRVATGVRAPERFVSIKEAANFEEWTRRRGKSAPGHGVNLSDMEGMETIPNLFEDIGWGPLLTVYELFYLEMTCEFYVNLHKGRVQKVGDPIRAGKIYNKHTFKRMGFAENEEGMLVKGGQDDSDESDEDDEGNEEQEAMDVDDEESEEEPEEETYRREMR
ncbi:hypothetical protein M9H77_30010 [Catharanthus roseus]|uniref:Uncharacterized protein n=1 Tax=Catharanthus roseus TaxID=4058 RepID=A0ACC0A0A7_CATRO|nr:hypothetical protein M9H77_30010 [Catharanthus roseus]